MNYLFKTLLVVVFFLSLTLILIGAGSFFPYQFLRFGEIKWFPTTTLMFMEACIIIPICVLTFKPKDDE